MKEFDSIRVVDKGESISFEMTGDVAEDPYTAIMFLFRATAGLIAAMIKDNTDPQEVAASFTKAFTDYIAQDIRDERERRAEEKAGKKEAEPCEGRQSPREKPSSSSIPRR